MIQKNEWVPPSEFVIREMNSLRGKMCSVIEGMHLPEKQERAACGHWCGVVYTLVWW